MSGIHSWPQAERPREKLLHHGAASLSNSELLAILLCTGTRRQTAVDLAREILFKFKTFRAMTRADIREWKTFRGLGDAKISKIQAALEIGRRLRQDAFLAEQTAVSSSRDIVDVLMPRMQDLQIEVFKVVFLDSANQVLDISDAACGTVDQAFPIIREIIHAALQKFASAIICAHNHPSGRISPSCPDRVFTRELSQACQLMNLRMLDHIIIGRNGYYSFADQGELSV